MNKTYFTEFILCLYNPRQLFQLVTNGKRTDVYSFVCSGHETCVQSVTQATTGKHFGPSPSFCLFNQTPIVNLIQTTRSC